MTDCTDTSSDLPRCFSFAGNTCSRASWKGQRTRKSEECNMCCQQIALLLWNKGTGIDVVVFMNWPDFVIVCNKGTGINVVLFMN